MCPQWPLPDNPVHENNEQTKSAKAEDQDDGLPQRDVRADERRRGVLRGHTWRLIAEDWVD